MYASYHRCTAEGSMGGKEDAILLCRFSLSKARQTRALAFVAVGCVFRFVSIQLMNSSVYTPR